MKPLFLGSHPAMDFLNTRPTPRGAPIELIGDGTSYVAWLEGAQLLQATTAVKLRRRFGTAALDAAATEARELRDWARGWIARWADCTRRCLWCGTPPPEPPVGASTVLSGNGHDEGWASGHRSVAHRLSG